MTTRNLENGIFQVKVQGQNGKVDLEVEISENKIINVNILEHSETESMARAAFKIIPDSIIKTQSIDVDAVSGATTTSQAIIAGVREVIEKAGGNISDFMVGADTKENAAKNIEKLNYDFVVVGGGAAGLTAALVAAENNQKVAVLETMAFLGGNTVMSAGIIQSSGTSVQEEHGIQNDAPKKFMDDLENKKSKYYTGDRTYSTIMHENSGPMIDKLRARGLEFVNFQKETPRYHVVAPEMYKGGQTLIDLLEKEAINAGTEIFLNTRGRELITEDGVVTGLVAETDKSIYRIAAKKVILGSGGFSSNKEMVAEALPEYAELNSRAGAGILGDGLLMSEAVGGYRTAMDSGQHMFHVSTASGIDVPLLMIYTGTIIVNKNGERYVDESGDYSGTAKTLAKQPDSTGYMIFDQGIRGSYKEIENYFSQGAVVEADSIEKLAEVIGLPNLPKTLARYNEQAEQGEDTDYGRVSNLMTINEGPFYAIEVEPKMYNSYGGLKIDTEARVITKEGDVIPNLYAAGEVTGAVEVQEGLAYTSGIAQALVYGEIAAKTALAEL